ncbi:MAG: hypothetical protein COV07_02330 [Candidatus Vogelbacteria bacterium CG10_big_fil_rev_8_21_14_0_10_45_14]|uniref:Uncharacterized protein n=1 Tax=Candidatus Vogelbacteria bacterium CG10_big_fil_rev_8_21_14_0_10_45_14 TaxID=1975042 RepID=A0A2H0RLY6_9BACT|nr:MAG: hypothetical protein COV07_02330 [Candidatus Vogelbacteria bacterium CG10_big_fil_rev_8_21_14_0_10_45_14]
MKNFLKLLGAVVVLIVALLAILYILDVVALAEIQEAGYKVLGVLIILGVSSGVVSYIAKQ